MKKLIALSFFVVCVLFNKAQSLDINWSEKLIYDNKIDGFFDGFVGDNDQYIYAKFSNLTFRPKKYNKKVKLLVFDKKTMRKVGEVKLKGYEKEKKDLDYFSTFVFKKVVYVIWEKESKKKNEYFAESFDEMLKRTNKLAKIYEYVEEKGHYDNVVFYGNKDAAKVLILKEFGITKDDENLKIEYKMLNADLSFGNVRQVIFPIQFSKKRRGLFSSNTGLKLNYELGNDGFLYVRDLIKMDEDERKELKRHESSTYVYFAQVNTDKGTIRDYKVKYDDKNTFFVNYILDKGKIKLYGFFSDLNKDSKGIDTHGIFYVCINNYSFKTETSHFEYFDKNFLDQLYATDQKDRKGTGALKSKKAKDSDRSSIDDRYVIEQTISDGPNLILFCSMMNNYSTTTCDTKGNCTTRYYCKKKNVTVFKLNQDGKFIWAKNLDREMTYSNWDVYDVRVIGTKNNYFVLYGSSKELNGKRKKLRSVLNGNLNYAVFSTFDGNYKLNEYVVNKKGTKKRDKKHISPSTLLPYDNKILAQAVRVRRKPGVFISLLFPPAYFFLQFNPNLMKGTGYLGTVTAKD
ncbi:MAG: hypothetical protein WCR21_05805 [Bacteroidota bacterium]